MTKKPPPDVDFSISAYPRTSSPFSQSSKSANGTDAFNFDVHHSLELIDYGDYSKLNSRNQIFFNKLIAATQANFTNPKFNVAHLAELMCLSQRQLFNKIRGLTNKNPKSFLNDCRIGYARLLLRRKLMSIGQISECAGFASASAFSRAFKRTTGQTPRQYRSGVSRSY